MCMVLTKRPSKYMKQNLKELKGETGNSTIGVADFNTFSVHLGYHNKIPSTGYFINKNVLLGSPRSRCRQVPCLARARSLRQRRHFLLCPHMAAGTDKLSRTLFIRALIPFRTALPLCPNHLPDVPTPNSTAQGVQFQHVNSGGREYSNHHSLSI